MRILITGGAGYIGATATSMLIDRGYEVNVLDDFSTGHLEGVDSRAKLIQGSLLNIQDIRTALSECEAVMHFAGKALVGESVEKPKLYEETNVIGSMNLLSEMKAVNVEKLVFSSTCATYGEPKSSPISEDAETLPVNPYGKTKLAVDRMITEEARGSLAAISLRYFNVAGALKSKNGWLSERHDPETHLIPNILKATTENPMKVFGNDWPTHDGTCIRDYIHVIDLIEAHIKALQNLKSGEHQIFNLGSGAGHSVAEVISAAATVVGHKIPHTFSPRRSGDPGVLVADISKAQSQLDWSPTRSLDEIVRDTWESQKDIVN